MSIDKIIGGRSMEDKLMRSKKTVIIALCAAIFLMAVGFAAFSTTLTITGTANVSSDWKVVFTNIDVVSKTDGATSKTADASGTSATFNVGLTSPGDRIIYTVTVENQGTLDAVIENIIATASDNPAIDFEISNIKIGDTLAKKTSTTFNVTISYDSNVTSQPDNTSNTLTVDITYVQDLGQDIPEKEPEIVTGTTATLAQKLQNEIASAQSDVGINFGAISSDTNGKGMYYTSTNTQDNKTVYYYRGEVENNYVQFGKKDGCVYNNEPIIHAIDFANSQVTIVPTEEQCLSTNVCDAGDIIKNNYGMNYRYVTGLDAGTCAYLGGTFLNDEDATYGIVKDILWRIVRVNEDGSIRLVIEDIVGASAFNTDDDDNAYVGYMYGTVGATGDDAYNFTHTNTTDSTIKDYLDDWYENKTNLSSYISKISTEAGFCNDRSVAPTANTWESDDTALGYAKHITYYGAYNRLVNNKEPQYACPNNSRDLFTTNGSNTGNAKLTNPIGLLTADEVAYAGGVFETVNESYYLANGTPWFTVSPFNFGGDNANAWGVDVDGRVDEAFLDGGLWVRPAINLKSSAVVTGGTGISTDPYVIQ